jgi:cytochrome c biogenesis protein CcmG, thiol:disulfide interchange protein DsbE
MPSEIFTPDSPRRVEPVSRQRRIWLRRALVLCAAGGTSALPLTARAHHLALGKPAPPLTLHTLDGPDIATSSLIGKVVIATFWATWCEPCRDELPLLSDYAARHAQDGLQVLGFSLDTPESLAAVRKIAATLSFPVGLLPSPWAGDYGRIWRLPVNFTIDRAGMLINNGWDDAQPAWTEERLRRLVTPLLRAPA